MSAIILVIEDEPAIQELLALNIIQSGHTPIRAINVETAQKTLRNTTPDLILLDWMLPGISGVDYARQLKSEAHTKTIPIIMLTARSDELDKVRGLELGADDYITKPFSPRELNARIKAVLRRRSPETTNDSIEIHGLLLDPSTHRATGHGNEINLGPIEFKLLHFFMRNAERVYSRTQLLDKIWGDKVFVEDRTVDVHIRRLRKALTNTGHEKLIQTVRGSGYRFSTK